MNCFSCSLVNATSMELKTWLFEYDFLIIVSP